MLKKVGFLVLVGIVLFSCSPSNKNEDGATKGGDKVAIDDNSATIKRQKIDKLTPKTFIEVTIDLTKQKEKWRMLWRKFIQNKRSEYFKSYGLSESKFNRYTQGNSSEIQNFLKDNPRYNKMYMDAMRNSSMNP